MANKEIQNEMLLKVCVASGEKAQPVDECLADQLHLP